MNAPAITRVAVVIGLLISTGCTFNRGPTINLRSVETQSRFSQRFDYACFSRDASGTFQIVVLDDGLRDAEKQIPEPGFPLATSNDRPLRQAICIRVFWRPVRGTDSDHPAATNAAVDWYLFGDTTAGDARNVLKYSGSGFVEIIGSGDEVRVRIRRATIKPTVVRGELIDPMGSANLTGAFDAVLDAELVTQLTREAQRAVAEPAPASTPDSPNAPPARTPHGP